MEKTLELVDIEYLVCEKRSFNLTQEELEVAREILNVLHENSESISSPPQILDFCTECLEYNPVPKFI